MVTYVATVGETIIAIINSFWEYLLEVIKRRESVPTRFIALVSMDDAKRGITGTAKYFEELKKGIHDVFQRVIAERHEELNLEIEKIDIPQEDPKSIANVILNLHEKYRDTKYIIDVTGGRKTMSIGAALGAMLLARQGVEVELVYFWLYNPKVHGSKKLSELAPYRDFEFLILNAKELLARV